MQLAAAVTACCQLRGDLAVIVGDGQVVTVRGQDAHAELDKDAL